MYSEMLEDGWAKDVNKQQDYYSQISKESGRLSRLIENVLQLARLEKGTYKVDSKTESPNKDFEEIGNELAEIARHQNFPLSTEAEPNIPPISYDPEALKQVLLILLDNSLKFAANGSDKNLAMTLKQEGNKVHWTWSDRGPGIPDAEIKKVFDKFYRVENEMTRTTKGTGIGLAMAHMIVEAMEAKIQATNLNEGGLEIQLIFDVQ
jgi:K+-sensing histidine kinase KdpD